MGDFRRVPRVRRWESSGREMSQIQNQIIVFVSNLPACLHWQGLWFAFARHGEVSDAFIPMKKSKSGTRFGFVRFLSLEYVERAISRLNGSVLFWSRVSATLARFSDGLESRMSKQVKNIESNKDASREDLSHPSRRDNVVEWISMVMVGCLLSVEIEFDLKDDAPFGSNGVLSVSGNIGGLLRHVDRIHVVNKTNVLGAQAQPQSDFAVAQCFGRDVSSPNIKCIQVLEPQVAPLAAASFQSVTLVRNTVDPAGTGELVTDTEQALDDDRSLGFSNEDIEVECENEMVKRSNKYIVGKMDIDE
ncbi:hypothetical protein GQ457_11G033050 [Hibiscus cannabinus]